MGKQGKTISIVEKAREILARYHPMTVRQVYYRLVSKRVEEAERVRLASAIQGF